MLIDINKIKVNDRIRKDFGNIEELAKDIEENGLINPPTVTPDFELIAGERRLRACKHLGYSQIEVRVMTVKDEEHQLKMEISENENRKEFTFSERVDWAKRLERIERIKARERKLSTLKQGDEVPDMQNFAGRDGITRDKVANQIGFGSGEQYRKAKFIFENADEDMINLLDEKKISIHKAYVTLKEQLNEKESQLKQLEESNNKLKQEKEKLDQLLTEERNKPQESVTVEVEKVIDNTDYDTINRLRSEIDELTELKKDYQNKYTNTLDSLSEAQNKIKLVMGENTEFTLVKDTTKNLNRIRELTLILLEYECNSDAFNNLPDATRREYVRAFNSVHKASSRLLGQVRTDDVIELSDNVVNLINYKEEN